jgi:hypothetical protein
MKRKPNIHIEKSGHIVVLDQNWHHLFNKKKPLHIQQLEHKLNKLLKEQGKVNTEYTSYKLLKKKMMSEIVEGMSEAFDSKNPEAVSKLNKNQKYIKEINAKTEHYEKRKVDLPEKIEAVNQQLLRDSMIICYERLITNKEIKSKLDQEIKKIHEQVKKLIGEKEDAEGEINQLYTFMHDVAGLDVIEQLDKFYFGGDE